MMGIDGTWRRDCIMEDVSETGAKLTVEGSVEGLHLKEFFLLLSSTGLAYRRCELSWVNGDQIGVNFLKPGDKKKKRQGAARDGGSLIDRNPVAQSSSPAGYGEQASLRRRNRHDMIAAIADSLTSRKSLKCRSSQPKPWSSPPVSACACAP